MDNYELIEKISSKCLRHFLFDFVKFKISNVN